MHRLGPYFLFAALAFAGAMVAAVLHVSQARAGRALVEVTIEDFGRARVDRCPTCHPVALGAEYPEGHPAVPGYHPVERFGCALCHGGEPRAADQSWAHRRGREPLLHLGGDSVRTERLESGCARCHLTLDATGLHYDPLMLPHVAQGHLWFTKRGCWGCHGLADVSLGERGPNLSDVGRRLNGEEIYRAIQDPSAAPSSTTMPRFRLPERERQDLVTFLLAQVDERRHDALTTSHMITARRPGQPPRRPPVDPGMAQGATIMAEMGCTACHRLEMHDGQVGPDLRWEGRLRGPRFVEDMVRVPVGAVHNSRMPPLDLSDSEVEAVQAYLARQLALPPPDAEAAWQGICARCHGLDGQGRTAVAPYLARRPRNLKDELFFRQVPVRRLAESLSQGVAGTPMAPWGRPLTYFQGIGLVNFLSQKLHQGHVPQNRRIHVVPRREDSTAEARAAAERAFRVECAQCHGPTGQGDGPDAASLRQPPRDLSNSLFIASLADRRLYESIAYGPPGEVMPGHLLGHSPAIVWELVAKVRHLAGQPLVEPHEDDEWPWQKTDRLRRQIRERQGTSPRQPSGEPDS